jgi:multiple sugar transport system substrate-binding protein
LSNYHPIKESQDVMAVPPPRARKDEDEMLQVTRWFALTIFLGSLVVGCASASPPTQPTISPGTKVLLRVGTGDSGQGLEPHREIIAQFEKTNPDIQVQLEPVAGSNYYELLLEQIAASNAPDIMQIGDDAVPMFVRKGAFVDLGPYINGNNPLDKNIYLPGVFQPGEWEGKQYFLPKDFSPLAVYYNKKLFDEHGVRYPKDGWTWDDFLATAKALAIDTNRDGKPETWGVQLPAAWTSGFEYWVAAAGGSLIGEDGKHFEGHMDSPETIAALQFYANLYNTYKVAPPPVGVSLFQGGNQEFSSGKAAMFITGHWPESDLKKNPVIDLGVVGMPVGKRRANVLFWSGFGIYSGSKNKEQAWRFLRYYVGEEGASVWKDWGLPSVASVAQSSGMTKDPIEGVWLNELAYLVPRAYVFTPYWGQTADPALQTVLQKAIVDSKADPASLLKQAAKQAQAAFDAIK